MKIDKEFIRLAFFYGIIGGFSALMDLALFTLLYSLMSVNIFLANALSVTTGIAISFSLNRKYNFKKEDKILRRALFFFSIGLVGLGLSQMILWIGDLLGYRTLLVKFCSIFIVAAFQFLLNKTITFRK